MLRRREGMHQVERGTTILMVWMVAAELNDEGTMTENLGLVWSLRTMNQSKISMIDG